MHYSEIPAMPPGTPKPNKLHLKPETTYFFKKSKGQFIAVDEYTAWRMTSGKNQIIGRQPKEQWEYVGRTDGKAFVKKVNEAFHFIEEGNINAYHEALQSAEKEEFLKAKKDKTMPPNPEIMGDGAGILQQSGMI